MLCLFGRKEPLADWAPAPALHKSVDFFGRSWTADPGSTLAVRYAPKPIPARGIVRGNPPLSSPPMADEPLTLRGIQIPGPMSSLGRSLAVFSSSSSFPPMFFMLLYHLMGSNASRDLGLGSLSTDVCSCHSFDTAYWGVRDLSICNSSNRAPV